MAKENDELDKLYEELKEQEKDEVQENSEENAVDPIDDDELMSSVVEMAKEDRKHADDYYNVFLPDVSMGKDRSEASKEAMGKAIELKISSAKNIIELIKLKKQKSQGNVGVFLGETMSSKKTGIDVRNLNVDDDE